MIVFFLLQMKKWRPAESEVSNVQSPNLKTSLAGDLSGVTCAHRPVQFWEDQGCSPIKGTPTAPLCRVAGLFMVWWACAFHMILRFSNFNETERKREQRLRWLRADWSWEAAAWREVGGVGDKGLAVRYSWLKLPAVKSPSWCWQGESQSKAGAPRQEASGLSQEITHAGGMAGGMAGVCLWTLACQLLKTPRKMTRHKVLSRLEKHLLSSAPT